MNKIEIKEGHWYHLRSGCILKALSVETLTAPNYWCIRVQFLGKVGTLDYDNKGQYLYEKPGTPFDILREVIVEDAPKPKTKEVYFNVNDDKGSLHIYYASSTSRSDADRIKDPNRVACKRVVFTEGEYDD